MSWTKPIHITIILFTQIARCPGRLSLVEKYTGHVRTPNLVKMSALLELIEVKEQLGIATKTVQIRQMVAMYKKVKQKHGRVHIIRDAVHVRTYTFFGGNCNFLATAQWLEWGCESTLWTQISTSRVVSKTRLWRHDIFIWNITWWWKCTIMNK